MNSGLKFSVGYQLPDQYRISDVVASYAEWIGEVYFPWLNIPGGRGISIRDAEDQEQMEAELREIHALGIKLNLLWNANCHGGKAISKDLERQFVETLEYLIEHIGLEAVTTTSLFVARIIKESFPRIEVRASVNMGIGTLSGMKYVRDYFDSFYLQRELNRYPSRIKPLREWGNANGKRLYLLANSGCLKNCSAHTFHDNLVAHEHELSKQQNRWPGFGGICRDFYADPENHYSFLHDSTWIRPEDVSAYAGLVDGIKLATRSHRNPAMVIESYVKGNFSGNTLALCEPDFSALAYLDNTAFPSAWMQKLDCISEFEQETYCREVWDHVKR